MNCREKIEAVFKGKLVDKVPFALKGWRIPQCETERILRNEGLCVIDARAVYKEVSPNIKEESMHFTKNGRYYVKTMIKTPKENLTSLTEKAEQMEKTEQTSWQIEKIFKTPDDYDAIEFMIKDREYLPDYEPFIKAEEQIGGDAFFKTYAPGSPLHEIIHQIMGIETFSIEWAERREKVMALYEAIAENNRKIYSIIAKSPAMIVQCGGNYTPEVLGKERFIKYVLPHWEEATEILHQGGKLVGCHLDANNKLWAKEVGESKLDWIEAFTPAPDTDMTVAEARRFWPGKVLFINFPSSVHLQKANVIAETTKQILKESAPGDSFIIGITENVPENRWRESFLAIARTVDQYGQLPIEK